MAIAGTIHMVGQFLPWHRYYLSVFESVLREECGYTGPMTWWDETRDAGDFEASGLFVAEYFGDAPVKTAAGQGACVSTGVSVSLVCLPSNF
jgi:tyrosinase